MTFIILIQCVSIFPSFEKSDDVDEIEILNHGYLAVKYDHVENIHQVRLIFNSTKFRHRGD